MTSKWIQFPTLYEINTWVWLAELSRTVGRSIDLSCVPMGEWDRIAKYGFHAVWLMASGSEAPQALQLPIRTGIWLTTSGEPCLILSSKTMSGHPTAFDATSWKTISAAPKVWPLPDESLQTGA